VIHSRFDLAFAQGHIFSAPEGPIRAVVHRVCDLRVTSGLIVAGDPWSLGAPFARAIAPGSYPVELCVAQLPPHPDHPDLGVDRRVAAARVRLRPEPAVAWEMAATAEENLNDLGPHEFFGFGVGSGTACFVDADAVPLFSEDGANTRLDALLGRIAHGEGCVAAEELHEAMFVDSKGVLTDQLLRRLSGDGLIEGLNLALPTGNLVAFGAGFGDGRYPCYWGLDGDRNTVSLIADFRVLVQRTWDSAVVPSIGNVPNGPLRLGGVTQRRLDRDRRQGRLDRTR
jgi:Protein of unknown function (DUF4241)